MRRLFPATHSALDYGDFEPKGMKVSVSRGGAAAYRAIFRPASDAPFQHFAGARDGRRRGAAVSNKVLQDKLAKKLRGLLRLRPSMDWALRLPVRADISIERQRVWTTIFRYARDRGREGRRRERNRTGLMSKSHGGT